MTSPGKQDGNIAFLDQYAIVHIIASNFVCLQFSVALCGNRKQSFVPAFMFEPVLAPPRSNVRWRRRVSPPLVIPGIDRGDALHLHRCHSEEPKFLLHVLVRQGVNILLNISLSSKCK